MDYTTVIRDLIDKLEAIVSNHDADVLGSHDNERTDDEQPIMMPPQTQKLELLKKAVGVESQYDDDCEDEVDEIAELKRRAGINPAALDGLGDELLD
jgi:hypothetical protein